MRTSKSWFLTLLLSMCFLGGALSIQNHMIFQFYQEPEKYRESLYVPSEGYLRAISLGYNQFFADFFWLRMIQGFAAGWSRPENADQMDSYFMGITELDPKFIEVYSFGIMAIGEQGHRDDLVRKIVLRSFEKLPGNWRIPSEGAAYFALNNQKDLDLAKFYVRLAMLSPEHPLYLENWIGYFDVKQGRFRAAYEKYMVDYIQAVMKGEEVKSSPEISRLRQVHLLRAIDEWIKSEINQRVQEWVKRTGQVPTLEQLNQAGAFRGVVLPDWAAISAFLTKIENTPKMKPARPEEIRDVIQRFVKTWDRLPDASPGDQFNPQYAGYVIMHDPEKKGSFLVMSKAALLRRYQYYIETYEDGLPKFKEEHKRVPQNFTDIVTDMRGFRDPLGGEFKIDPKTGYLTITSAPNIRELIIPNF